MVYAPVGRKFKVRMAKITGPTVKAWWLNPRDGKAIAIGEFPNTGERAFLSPISASCAMGCWCSIIE